MNGWSLRHIGWIISLVAIVGLGISARHVFGRTPTPAVTILMYHGVQPNPDDQWTISSEDFENQMQKLKALGYETIWPADLAAYKTQARRLPERPLVITFDDGLLSVKTYAEPILKKYGFKATVYLIAGSVAETLETRGKSEGHAVLTWPEVLEMQSGGHLRFGSHASHHLRLNAVPNPEEEVKTSRQMLLAHGVAAPDSFSYPFGAYDERVLDAVKRAGFTTAMTCDRRFEVTSGKLNLLALPRYWVTSTAAFPLEQIEEAGSQAASGWSAIPWSKLGTRWFMLIAAALLILGLCDAEFSKAVLNRLDALCARPVFVPAVIALCSFMLLGALLLQHFAFQTSAYDLRLHEDIIRNTWYGKFMYSSFLGRSFLGVHASLIFAVLSPLYMLWPGPVWLIILQGICVGGAAWFLWRLTREKGLRPAVGFCLVVSFFFYRGMVSSVFAGFHQEVLAIFFLLGLFWSLETRRRAWAAVFCMLALLCREDAALPLAVYGALCAFKREQRAEGLALFVVSTGWFFAVTLWLIPQFAVAGRMDNLGRWSAYGATVPEIAWGFVTHPLNVLAALFKPGVVRLLSPLLFLPLFNLKTVLPLLLPVALCVTSSFVEQSSLNGAYPALFVAYLFAGTVAVLSYAWVRRRLNSARLTFLICLAFLYLNLRQLPWPETLAGARKAHAGLAQIAPALAGKRVMAQGSIIPHLGWPKEVYLLGSPGAPYFSTVDVVLLSQSQNPWPKDQQDIAEIDYKLSRSGKWRRERFGSIVCFTRMGVAKP